MRETARARQAYADYLALGPDRSLEKLLKVYQRRPKKAPTRQLAVLKRWSAAFGWQSRLMDIAVREATEAERREAEYRRAIMEEGYALPHERVRLLKDLAATLSEELLAEGEASRRWVKDVKSIGSGETAQRVDIERFNAAEVEQLRGLLDDIAKEKGERKDRHEISGPDGAPLQMGTVLNLAILTDEELSTLEQLVGKAGAPALPEPGGDQG